MRIGTSDSLEPGCTPQNTNHATASNKNVYCSSLLNFFKGNCCHHQELILTQVSFENSPWMRGLNPAYWRRQGHSPTQQVTRVIHRHQFYACHPSNLFLRGALKKLITPHFSLRSIPNPCGFCPFLSTLIPGCSVSLFLTDTCPGIRPAVWHTHPVTVVGRLPLSPTRSCPRCLGPCERMLWARAGRSREGGMHGPALPGEPRPAPWGGQG